MGYGTKMEPLWRWDRRVWAIYGGIYFLSSSKKTGRTTLVSQDGKVASLLSLNMPD